MPPERTSGSPSGTPWHVTTGVFSWATKAGVCYTGRAGFVAISPNVPIRHAQTTDLPEIVAIYNASIPGHMATADTVPVTLTQREDWFREFSPSLRPLWVHCADSNAPPDGWLSLRSFYGRPAYHATVELGVYVAPAAQRRGIAGRLLDHALLHAPVLGIRTMLAFVFGHNTPSIALLQHAGFVSWGRLPRVAELGGVERDLAILGRRVG